MSTDSYWVFARKVGLRATDPRRAVGILRDYQIVSLLRLPEPTLVRIANARRKLALIAEDARRA